MTNLTIGEFAQRAAGGTRRQLVEGDAFTVVDEENLPDNATP